VNTERPRSEKVIDLISTIRKAVAFDIQLTNPLNEPATFEVLIEGEGLIGDPVLYLNAQETVTYEVLFSPLRVFHGQGAVAFIHEKLGEIWY